MQKETEREQCALVALEAAESIAEKKAKIHSRLLTDAELAKNLERLAKRHEKRRIDLQTLVCGKAPKTKNEQGMYEVNEK